MLNPTYVSSWQGSDAPISHSPSQHPKHCPLHPPQHPHGHVSEVGCCLRALPICGCNSASGPSTLVQAKKSRAGCTFCRSFDVVVKSTTCTTLLHQERLGAPVVVVLRGNRPGNLGLGPELPALSTTYPASLYKCSALLSNMNNCTWGPYPPFLMYVGTCVETQVS